MYRSSSIGSRESSRRPGHERACAAVLAWLGLGLVGPGATRPAVAAPDPGVEPAASKSVDQPRPPYVRAAVGAILTGRYFHLRPASQPRFNPSMAPGVHADVAVFPLAKATAAHGLLSGLGLAARMDKPLWPDSQPGTDPMRRYGTSELRVEGGLRWRVRLGGRLARFQPELEAGGGWHSFAIDKAVGATGIVSDAGPPDVGYRYLTFGAGLGVRLVDGLSLLATFHYHVVGSAGAIESDSREYGPASTFGLRASAGLSWTFYRHFQLIATGLYEYWQLTFDNPAHLPKRAMMAFDLYWGGSLSVGFVY